MIWGACMLVMCWLFVEQHLGIKCIPCHSHTYALKAVVCVCVCVTTPTIETVSYSSCRQTSECSLPPPLYPSEL